MATTTQIKAGYVQIEDGSILVQVPSETSRWGFCLADAFGEETQSWDGGFGVAGKWTLLADNDPPHHRGGSRTAPVDSRRSQRLTHPATDGPPA